MKPLLSHLTEKQREWATVLLVFGLLLAIFHGIYGRFFPTAQGTLGHDMGLAFAGMLDGYIWFAKNGMWEVPWFSPAFCGGQPYFADPQSGYYSLLQWLTFITDPLSATYLTLLLFASVGFFGTYLLARLHFGLALPWAILAAALYFFNGFLPHRMIIGHLGYPALTLAPWLALALLTPAASRVSTIGLGLLAGLIAATWLQSGLTTLMLPAALSVALILLVYRLRQPWPGDLLPRMVTAVGISVILSASKLVASLAFYSRFERTQYLLPGFDNPLALLVTNLLALFGPSQTAYLAGEAWLVNVQWTLLPHEWAYGFTVVPLLILVRARVLLRRRASMPATGEPLSASGSRSRIDKGVKIAVILAILAIVLIPLAMQFYTPAYNAWLKGLPLVGATAAPIRWLIVYLPVLPIVTALLGSHTLARQGQEDRASRLVFSFMLMIIVINVVDPRRFYFDQPYDPEPLLAGYAQLAAGGAASQRIKAIGLTTPADAGEGLSGLSGNDVMIAGISQMRCYNPSFGYRLEHLPPARLEVGDVLAERDGLLNIRNPACFVFPEENGCQPGDQFRADQRAEAEAFVAYAPFPFNKSRGQRVADGVTMGGLVGTAIFLGLAWPLLAWWRRRGRD
jgi:hypothetical protein